MQYGEEQCRNVESSTATPVAVAREVHRDAGAARTAVELQRAERDGVRGGDADERARAGGTTASVLTTMRCEPVTAMPEMLAPGSPASVRSAAGPPRPLIATVP